MSQKLVVFDLDGTLLKDDKTITKQSIEAIKCLKEKDYLVTFATGRSEKMTQAYRKELAITLPIIACNGAHIEAYGGIPEYRHPLNKQVLLAIVNFCKASCIHIHLYSHNEVYSEIVKNQIIDIHGDTWTADEKEFAEVTIVSDILELIDDNMAFFKILVPTISSEIHTKVLNMLNDLKDIEVYAHEKLAFEIAPKNTSKGNGLKVLCKMMNISLDHVIVFGDGENDFSTFEIAGMSIAMANGSPQLKAMAHHITKSNEEDGVAHAIYTWLL